MLEAALAAGVAAAGGDALLGGVLPTPAAPILVRRLGLDLAAVVSASHNPYRDNGIKFFAAAGTQARRRGRGPDRGPARRGAGRPRAPGRVRELHGGLEDYLRALEAAFPLDLSGHPGPARLRQRRHLPGGAGDLRAPRRRGRGDRASSPTGATSTTAAARPTSSRLAAHVAGGRHDDRLRLRRRRRPRAGRRPQRPAVRRRRADRARRAAAWPRRGELGGGVAVTVMTNYGFHRAMEEAGIEVAMTKVGDRYVLEELRERGWALGGEQSGHIIDTASSPPATASPPRCRRCASSASRDLADAVAMEKLPQTLVNVEVADREALAGATAVWEAVEREGARARGPRPRARAPLRHRAARAGDGRGADRRGGRRGLRAAGRDRPPRARLSAPAVYP